MIRTNGFDGNPNELLLSREQAMQINGGDLLVSSMVIDRDGREGGIAIWVGSPPQRRQVAQVNMKDRTVLVEAPTHELKLVLVGSKEAVSAMPISIVASQ